MQLVLPVIYRQCLQMLLWMRNQWLHYLSTALELASRHLSEISCKAVSEGFLANVNSRSRSLYAIARPSVCLSVCLSVTLVHPTQAVQIFGNISTAFGTLAIH